MKKEISLGDALNLLYLHENGERELFGSADGVEGMHELIGRMLGFGEEQMNEFIRGDWHASLLTEMCIQSLRCQLPQFRKVDFRNSLQKMKKEAKYSVGDEDVESAWLKRQCAIHGETVSVESIAFLFVPTGQERFEYQIAFEVFNDRPMNTN